MSNKPVKRLSLKFQISKDPFKVFAFFEKIIITFITVFVALFLTIKIEIMTPSLIGGVIVVAIGASIAVFAKKMYYDQALSELITTSNTGPIDIERHIISLNYKKSGNKTYSSNIKLFSIFFHCNSELITLEKQSNIMVLTGPYDKMESLFKSFNH
ncbi:MULTISPECIES: hypothetical protein [unclassified Pseudomonas]|uniref:hypothetical protein n=1 Tax=unclassified Pseudomonas TaxID=196821 RepID=UPI002E807AA2|nr:MULTISPECIES: hypothetical protein [unclassified Pseudomonas]